MLLFKHFNEHKHKHFMVRVRAYCALGKVPIVWVQSGGR